MSAVLTQLAALDELVAPETLFQDVDAVLKTYRTIKKEYTAKWPQYAKNQKRRASLSKSPKKIKNKSTAAFVKEVESFVASIKALHNSFQNCVSDIVRIQSQMSSAAAVCPITDSIPPPPPPDEPQNAVVHVLIKRARSQHVSITSAPNPAVSINFSSTKSSTLKANGANLHNYAPKDEHHVSESSRVRSFGSLFSREFQFDVAHRYRKSIAMAPIMEKKESNASSPKALKIAKQKKVSQYFHDNYYGQNEVFETPFGYRPVIYCDWTASGKLLSCVETYLQNEMYTLYANTHTTTSITGIQTSKFRSEARSIILTSLGGDPQQDAVVFTGSGVTGAIYKIANILMKSTSKSYKPESTVVFISIYEHNSNIYIWKELGIKVVVIPEDKQKGALSLKLLEKKLKLYTSEHMKGKYTLLIGSFTAASNVSGIIAPIDETTALLHEYGALSFWDYATAGPYMDVCMTNKENPLLSKDAVFISTHKYLAGPGAPGILCAKKSLFTNYVPVIPGGGTVFAAFGIEDGEWQYLDNIEEREEGGTPDIIGSVRAAFVFLIKDHLSTQFIEETEKRYLKKFLSKTKSCPNLVMMGNTECDRLPVLSFLITHTQKHGFGASGTTKYLHYNFIAALLNDLFGIQGRGGCACAGMYGMYTLGLHEEEVDDVLEQMRDEKNEIARPGYFRINLHYTLNQKELKYIIRAVNYVCANGWKFLPLYDIDKSTGNYFHRDMERKPELLRKQLRSLLDISFDKNTGAMKYVNKHMKVDGKQLNDNLDKFFAAADNILQNLQQYLPSREEINDEDKIKHPSAWYWLPSEVYEDVLNFTEKTD